MKRNIIITMLLASLGSSTMHAQSMSRREKRRQRSKEERQKRELYRKPKAEIDTFEGLSNTEAELFKAAAKGDTETIVYLIQKVDPNTKDINGATPLFYAKNLRTVKLLVESGADVNAQNNEGIARLHMDVVFGRIRIVKYLLEHEADVNLATNTGVTPLHLATMISYLTAEEVEKVAEKALEVAEKVAGPGGVVAQVAAVVAAQVAAVVAVTGVAVAGAPVATVDIAVRNRIVDLLLKSGANPNAEDVDGDTPLHTLAAGSLLKPANRHGGVIMAEHLILRGAQRDVKNRKGQTPYDVAKEYKRFLLMPVLNPIRPRERVVRTLRATKKAAREGTRQIGRSIEKGGIWLQEKLQDDNNLQSE
jgi:ankyrin repeat protein